MIKKRVYIGLFLLFIMVAPLCASEGAPSSTVPVRFSFGTETSTHVEFGFTRNAVSDMSTIVTNTTNIELIETGNNTRKYTIPYELFAYWRLLAATDYTLSLRHTGYLDDTASSDPTDIIPFSLVCGTTTIPADTDTVIFTHHGSVTPTIQSKPVTVNAASTSVNASIYLTTLVLTFTAI